MSVSVNLCPIPKLQFNQNGVPLAGGKLFTYAAGTSTKLATYADPAGNTTNNNPILLDANGQCDCFLQGGLAYKLVLAPATDTDPPTSPYWTEDNVSGINQVLSTFGPDTGTANNYIVALTPAITSYADGQQVVFDAANTNTGGSTLNVCGLGPKQILINGAALVAGSIAAGQRYITSYKASLNAFLIIGSSAPSVQAVNGSFTGNVEIDGTLSGAAANGGLVSAEGIILLNAAAVGTNAAPRMSQMLGGGASNFTDVTTSRVLALNYVNNTGRPLYVTVGIYVASQNPGSFVVAVGILNNLSMFSSYQGNPTPNTLNAIVWVSFIVPPAVPYQVQAQLSSNSTGSASLYKWYEY